MSVDRPASNEVPLDAWINTRQTLHSRCHIIGKARMSLVPSCNHGSHITLLPDMSGLATGPMASGDGRHIEIAFDLIEHRFVVSARDGRAATFPLLDGLCMDFYCQSSGAVTDALAEFRGGVVRRSVPAITASRAQPEQPHRVRRPEGPWDEVS